MEKFRYFVIFLILSATLKNALLCPTNCVCHGSVMSSVICQGISAWPSGFTSSITVLSLQGSPTRQNNLRHMEHVNLELLLYLERLIITYSRVKIIDDGTFAGLNNLLQLSLANNYLTSLKGEMFRGLPKLKYLDVSGNHNCHFDESLFEFMRSLEELNVGNMGISKLSPDIFSKLDKLKTLKLYSNDLIKIDPAVLTPLTKLETLDLSGNLLRDLPKTMKTKLNSLKSLRLFGNPWQCHCQMYWLRQLKPEFLITETESEDVICAGPPKIRYQSYVNVPDEDFICVPPKVLRCDQSKYTIYVNHTLKMHCDFEGSPVPNITWIKHDGMQLTLTEKTQGKYTMSDDGSLVVNAVDQTDDGEWTFQVYNETVSDSRKVLVEVEGLQTTTTTTTTVTTTTSSTVQPTTITTIFPETSTTLIDSTEEIFTSTMETTLETDSINPILTSISLSTPRVFNSSASSNTSSPFSLQPYHGIHVACDNDRWNVSVEMKIMETLYPGIKEDDIFLGSISCNGTLERDVLRFRHNLQDCATSEERTNTSFKFKNKLIYAEHDPVFPFIIRRQIWDLNVECDVPRDAVVHTHVHYEGAHLPDTVVTPPPDHPTVSLAFYSDSRFSHAMSWPPLHVKVGDAVYVKAFTTKQSSDVKLILHSCYAQPYSGISKTMQYFLLKNGCVTDPNTQIILYSLHEVRFVYQQVKFSTNPEGLDIYCEASLCDVIDLAPRCSPTCIPENLIG